MGRVDELYVLRYISWPIIIMIIIIIKSNHNWGKNKQIRAVY